MEQTRATKTGACITAEEFLGTSERTLRTVNLHPPDLGDTDAPKKLVTIYHDESISIVMKGA
jgi:hypothetical protein